MQWSTQTKVSVVAKNSWVMKLAQNVVLNYEEWVIDPNTITISWNSLGFISTNYIINKVKPETFSSLSTDVAIQSKSIVVDVNTGNTLFTGNLT